MQTKNLEGAVYDFLKLSEILLLLLKSYQTRLRLGLLQDLEALIVQTVKKSQQIQELLLANIFELKLRTNI